MRAGILRHWWIAIAVVLLGSCAVWWWLRPKPLPVDGSVLPTVTISHFSVVDETLAKTVERLNLLVHELAPDGWQVELNEDHYALRDYHRQTLPRLPDSIENKIALAEARITLDIQNVSFANLLREIADRAGAGIEVRDGKITLIPMGLNNEPRILRAITIAPRPELGERPIDYRGTLAEQGMVFYEWDRAIFYPAAGWLLIRSTESQILAHFKGAVIEEVPWKIPSPPVIKESHELERILESIVFEEYQSASTIPLDDALGELKGELQMRGIDLEFRVIDDPVVLFSVPQVVEWLPITGVPERWYDIEKRGQPFTEILRELGIRHGMFYHISDGMITLMPREYSPASRREAWEGHVWDSSWPAGQHDVIDICGPFGGPFAEGDRAIAFIPSRKIYIRVPESDVYMLMRMMTDPPPWRHWIYDTFGK